MHFSVPVNILLLYPGESLKRQIGRWALRHRDRNVGMSFERSLPEIRNLVHHADMVLVDATEDPSQATDVFLQAVARLGVNAVAMYTEATHHELEQFVRMHGSLFLLGPLPEDGLVSLFGRLPERKTALPILRHPKRRRSPAPRVLD